MTDTRTIRKYLYHGLALSLLLSGLLYAGVTGKIAGKVLDKKTGEPMGSVNILVQGLGADGIEDDSFYTGTATDDSGDYFIINMPPGLYIVKASAIGFNMVRQEGVQVSVDRTTRIDFELEVTVLGMKEVIVNAERKHIQKDLTSSAVSVSAAEIDIMPVNSVGEILDLQAGMVRDAGGDLHIRGGRTSEITYLIDGIQVVDALSRRSGVTVDNQSISELQAITGTFNAEYGQALSGVVNIVTKSGSKNFQANFKAIMSDYYSNSDVYSVMNNAEWVYTAANAKTIQNNPINYDFTNYIEDYNDFETVDDAQRFLEDKPYHTYVNYLDTWNPVENMDYQLNLSGPILGDSDVTYFISARYVDSNGYQFGKRYFMPWGTDAPVLDSLNTWTMPNREVVPLNWRKEFSSQSKFFVNVSDAINVTYGLYYSKNENIGAGYSYKYRPDATKTYYTESQTHILAVNHMLSPKAFYEFKLSFFKKDHENYLYKDPYDYRYIPTQSADVAQYVYGANPFNDIELTGTANDFGFFGNETDQGFNMVSYSTVKFDMTSQVNTHNLIKFGLETRMHDIENEWYDLQFSDRYETLIMPISSPYHEYYQHNPFEASAYIQDKIEFKEMIINAGIRFDFFDSDGRILTDPSDPQIYNPFNPNHIYSNYTSDLPDSLLIEATVEEREEYWYKDAETKKQISPRIGISFPITDRGVIHFSYGHFFQTPALSYLYRNPEFEVYGAGTEQYIGNADLDAERTVMYEVGIQQAISRDVTLHATAFYRDIRDWVGMSPPIDTYSARTTYQKYINKDYASVQGVTITTRYDADVFTAKLDYTFMEARGTTSDPLDAYYDAQDDRAPRVQMVILDWDQAHTANFFIANRIQNWSASCIVRLNSGLPYTPTYPRGEKFGSSSFVGLTENIGRRPYTFNIDLRFIKSWKIEGIRYELAIDVTNVLDSRTARNVYSDSGRPDFTRDSVLDTYNYRIVEISNVDEYFRRPGNFYPPRRIQLGFSIGF